MVKIVFLHLCAAVEVPLSRIAVREQIFTGLVDGCERCAIVQHAELSHFGLYDLLPSRSLQLNFLESELLLLLIRADLVQVPSSRVPEPAIAR